MIEFLKKSTFETKDVLQRSWKILMRQYFSIAGLCLVMFLISSFSVVLSSILSELNFFLRIFILLVFLIAFFGTQLTLLKLILQLLDTDQEKRISIYASFPSKRQLLRFFVAMIYFFLGVLGVFFLITLLILPLVYTGINRNLLASIALLLGAVISLLTWLRISFFPFFIIDRALHSFQSIRFSLAITRGNIIRLLVLFSLLILLNLLYLALNYYGLYIVSILLSILNSFFVIPMTSVVLTVAYRQMMGEYKGGSDPEIMSNII